MEERESIVRLKKGDIGGLEALVEKYQLQAIRAAFLIVQDRPLAEDIVQSAFIRAYERIGQFDSSRPFGPWFLRSVANDSIKASQRHRHTISLDIRSDENETSLEYLLADGAPGPDTLAEEAERAEAIWKALQKLPVAQRAAIVLRYYVGLSYTEIARQTESTPATTRWRLHAGRERLRKWLSFLNTAESNDEHERVRAPQPVQHGTRREAKP